MDALRRRIILAAANTPTPERVAYIRGGGDGSYIDTGIKPDINTRIVVWARNWLPAAGALFGARGGLMVDEFEVAANGEHNVDRLCFTFGAVQTFIDDAITTCFSNYHKYEINGPQFSIDDVLKAVSPETALTCNYNIYLFGMNNGGTASTLAYPADIMACKIYQNDVLVMDLTPVRTPYVGFYDSVTDSIYSNNGDGELTYNEYNPYAYKPLKYVSSTAEQYTDTGVIGGYSVPFTAQVSPKATTPKWNIPVSARYSTDKRCEYFFGNQTRANYDLSAGYSGGTQQISITQFYGTKVDFVKKDNVFSAYMKNAPLGSQKTFSASTDYTTDQPFIIGGTFENEAFKPSESFEGDIYYAGFGKYENYVPAMVGGVAGFYDTYNDKFHESLTDKPFIAGPGLDEQKGGETKTIPYIRGGGDGSYIETGIIPDTTTTMTIWARNVSPNGTDSTWFAGSRKTYNNSAYLAYVDGTQYIGKMGFCYGASSYLSAPNAWKYFTEYHKYEISGGALYIDDQHITGTTSISFPSPFSIHIIGINNSGSHLDSNARMDICSCQIHKGGELVRDFVPAQVNGVIGLYDSVSDTLFTNAGTGSFEYGEFTTNRYQRLEYIFTDANAYFDSGVYGKYTDDFVVRIMATSSEPRWHNLFGVRAVNSCFEVAFGREDTTANTYCYWRCGIDSGATHNKTVVTDRNFTNKDDIVIRKKGNATNLYVCSGSTTPTGTTGQIGTGQPTSVDTGFTTTYTLSIGTIKQDNGVIRPDEMFRGRIYYFRLGNERSFIPVRMNNQVGMYDTYHETFYPSLSDSPFIAGPVLE